MSLFLLHILSVPGIIEHLNNIIPDILNSLLLQNQSHILAKSIKFLSQDQQLQIHFNALEGSYALCLTANLVHLVRFSGLRLSRPNTDYVEMRWLDCYKFMFTYVQCQLTQSVACPQIYYLTCKSEREIEQLKTNHVGEQRPVTSDFLLFQT